MLGNSVEEKRKLLDKIYLEAAGGNENSENKPNEFGVTMLKKVQFEYIDTTDESKVEKNFNSTFTITKVAQLKENNSFKSKCYEKTKKKIFASENEKSDAPKTQKSPKTVSKPVQRQEKKLKFDADLKEIRDKILVRKFAYIWLRKNLNKNKFLSKQKCILPSEAQDYYEKRTLKNILKRWHTEVRYERNEWRLNVKAECHHNYVLCNKMWSQWKEFLMINVYEKNISNKADSHCNDF
ncbi:SFI1 -like protein [Brachionus plicatilis]|uniref:SFI1-like protein n=1 Tax=Brachionus plicatilis TaxID=10195 RepID=A0A3M7P6V5_BRAPC|nr:SFI1 -like protein [Brachionus plicatilis]